MFEIGGEIAGTGGQSVGVVTITVAEDAISLADASAHVTGIAVGRTAAGNTIVAHVERGAKTVAGVISSVGATATVSFQSDAALAAVVVFIDTDSAGNTVRLRVTGVAIETIDWDGSLRLSLRS